MINSVGAMRGTAAPCQPSAANPGTIDFMFGFLKRKKRKNEAAEVHDEVDQNTAETTQATPETPDTTEW